MPPALGQGMHGTRAAPTHGTRSFGHFVTNVAALEPRPGLIGEVLFAPPAADSLRVLPESLGAGPLHCGMCFRRVGLNDFEQRFNQYGRTLRVCLFFQA